MMKFQFKVPVSAFQAIIGTEFDLAFLTKKLFKKDSKKTVKEPCNTDLVLDVTCIEDTQFQPHHVCRDCAQFDFFVDSHGK